MPRLLKDWLPAFMAYTEGMEAPRIMHFWAGVSAIAGALRRKVWIDMKRFKWYPSFYITFVADPGIVSKTTTMDLSMDLLRKVPEITFGPDAVTWQALAGEFVKANTSFQFEGAYHPMSPLTLASGEWGNLVDPMNKDMINFLITMWDGRSTFDKVTKGSGNDAIECPWINMIACTTPHWIADNMPAAAVGGGFTSRCIFVFAEAKEKLVALPDENVSKDYDERQAALIADLEHISLNLVGPYHIPEEARIWIRAWYEILWENKKEDLDDEQFKGYRARKQTHMMKLAMVMAASRKDELVIDLEDFVAADKFLRLAEKDMQKVFSRIGRTEESLQAERLINFIRIHGKVSYAKALEHVHRYFPDAREFEGILGGIIKMGAARLAFEGPVKMVNGTPTQDAYLVYTGDSTGAVSGGSTPVI